MSDSELTKEIKSASIRAGQPQWFSYLLDLSRAHDETRRRVEALEKPPARVFVSQWQCQKCQRWNNHELCPICGTLTAEPPVAPAPTTDERSALRSALSELIEKAENRLAAANDDDVDETGNAWVEARDRIERQFGLERDPAYRAACRANAEPAAPAPSRACSTCGHSDNRHWTNESEEEGCLDCKCDGFRESTAPAPAHPLGLMGRMANFIDSIECQCNPAKDIHCNRCDLMREYIAERKLAESAPPAPGLVLCNYCGQLLGADRTAPAPASCPKCGGKGYTLETSEAPYVASEIRKHKCIWCNGTGTAPAPAGETLVADHPCGVCGRHASDMLTEDHCLGCMFDESHAAREPGLVDELAEALRHCKNYGYHGELDGGWSVSTIADEALAKYDARSQPAAVAEGVWTKEPPEVDGWYWWKEIDQFGHEFPEECGYLYWDVDGEPPDWMWDTSGDNSPYVVSRDRKGGFWHGPLKPPPLPAGGPTP